MNVSASINKRNTLEVTGLERDYYLIFNPILVEIKTPLSLVQLGSNKTGLASIKLSHEGKEIDLRVTLVNGKAIIRVDEAIQSIITPPKLQQNGMNQEGLYRVQVSVSATIGSVVHARAFSKYFVYGGSDFSSVKHTTNNYVSSGLTSVKYPFFKGYTNYVYAVVGGNIIPFIVREGLVGGDGDTATLRGYDSININLSNNCDMITELQYRNRSGGVNLWVFNNYTIKPKGKNTSYTNPINDFKYQERGELGYDITLHSKADKRLRNYIENVIASQEIRIRGLNIDDFDNAEVKPNNKEWLNLTYESLSITETHKQYMDIELKLSI